MWDKGQKKSYAKDLWQTAFESGRATKYLTGVVREAIVEAHVFRIIRGQMAASVTIEAMDDLIEGVRAEVALISKNPGFFD